MKPHKPQILKTQSARLEEWLSCHNILSFSFLLPMKEFLLQSIISVTVSKITLHVFISMGD